MRASASLAVLACVMTILPPVAAQQPRLQQQPVAPTVRIQPPVAAARTCAASVRDCDQDGENSIQHGGADCDDNDRERSSQRTEIADNNGRDEDCDASTFGVRDLDKDGETDVRVYNTAAGGRRIGGTDCDDTRKAINTSAQELPNKVDDDCNGIVDDLLGDWFTPRP